MGGERRPGKKKKAGAAAAAVGAVGSSAGPNEQAALAMEQMAQQLQAMMGGELGANAGVCAPHPTYRLNR